MALPEPTTNQEGSKLWSKDGLTYILEFSFLKYLSVLFQNISNNVPISTQGIQRWLVWSILKKVLEETVSDFLSKRNKILIKICQRFDKLIPMIKEVISARLPGTVGKRYENGGPEEKGIEQSGRMG